MKILAIELSSSHRNVAVVEARAIVASAPVPPHATRNTQHEGPQILPATPPALLSRAAEAGDRRAIGLIEQALRDAHCEREELAVIAVGLGPGSYTGIRGAIALAQGWQIGRGTKLLGISSVECLAAQARAAGLRGIVNIIIDAQRNEFYLAVYHIDAEGARQIEPLHLAAFARIENLAGQNQQLIGPDIAQWFPGATNIFPDAATLGNLASSRCDFAPGEKLEPIYLRETAFKKAPPPMRGI